MSDVILFSEQQTPVLWLKRGDTVNLGADSDFELRYDEQANTYDLLKTPFGKGEGTPSEQFFFFQDLFELARKHGYTLGSSQDDTRRIESVELTPGVGQDNSKQILHVYVK
ncbi:hypothetical protein [Furfurilactobacillus entadae]|uniref:hypothetical protein n=1 Tax=Furfurilactobacillus entadae TaxID=2922307 RepID=UPI0035EDAF61